MSDQTTTAGRTPPREPGPDPVRARWADDGVVDPDSLDRYRTAVEFALVRHTEVRKGGRGVPYLAHLLDVSSTVFEDGGTLEAAIAGLLHDVVEDQHVPYGELTTRFGERVAAIVRGCTDSGELSPTDVKGPFLERKRAHLAGLADRARRIGSGTPHPEDDEVLTVTAADKCSNLRATLGDLEAVGPEYFATFKGGLFITHWYYATVTGILAEARPTSRTVLDLRRELARLTERRDVTAAELAPVADPLAAAFRDLDAPIVVPGVPGVATPLFGRGRTETMSADLERTLVALESVRVARAAGGDPRAAVERFLLDCFVPGAAKQWPEGEPIPAVLTPFADAVVSSVG